MQHTTRNKFLVAVAAGALTCGGAIATATVSNADQGTPAGSSTSATGAPTSTTTSGPSTDPTTDPTGTATSTGSSTTAPSKAHATVTPFLNVQGQGKGSVSYRVDGEVLAGSGNVQDYVEADIEVDGKHIPSAHPAPIGPDAQLRPIHLTHHNPFVVDLAPGKHTVKVELAYYVAEGKFATVTATKTVTVGTGSDPAPSTDPAQPGEPPTPSPKTTQLGVTG